MASTQLPNYLRAHRKRLALSQDEVAFLLGLQSGSRVCRNERYVHVPTLETAFAYEVIFQKPARELFDGLFQQVAQDVAMRAKVLTHRTDRKTPNRRTTNKRQMLASIAARQSDKSFKIS